MTKIDELKKMTKVQQVDWVCEQTCNELLRKYTNKYDEPIMNMAFMIVCLITAGILNLAMREELKKNPRISARKAAEIVGNRLPKNFVEKE